jgi:hypothetical protein
MKDTLGYKILKYLSLNDNGEYIDISDLENNKTLLNSKLDSLHKEKLISRNGRIELRSGNGTDFKINSIKAKIEFKGIEYLRNVDNSKTDTITTNNFNNSTIGQVIHDSDFSNSQNTNNKKEQPSVKPDQKSPVKKAWDFISNNKLILFIFGVIFEQITWGNIWKIISNLF